MSPKEKANPLKTLVISMGFLLIGGTILLMAVVWKKVASDTAKLHGECAGGKIDLKGHGQLVNTLTDGHIIRITFKKQPGSTEIVSVDLCAGKLLGSLSVETDK